MPAATATLTVAEAACLDVIRSGPASTSFVALNAKLTLKEASASLAKLTSTGLITRADRYRWNVTAHGGRVAVSVLPRQPRRRGGKRFGEVRPGTSAERLLTLLKSPRRGPELASELGVSLQRVRQIVLRLSAVGLIEIGDPDRPLRAVWRAGRKPILLNSTVARVLSAVPVERGTTSGKIAVASRVPREEVEAALRELSERGFITQQGHVFAVTRAGADHWQHNANARRAEPPPLPVRSERVRDVLEYLRDTGPTRTRDIGQALGISRYSMNALVQYLKRKGLVVKCDGDRNAPHELTDVGRNVLSDLRMDLAA